MRTSVIIPAHNAERTIGLILESIQNSAPPPSEIVVVDDGSSDHTAEIAEKLGARVKRLPKACGAGYARIVGSRVAQGEILVFIDSDIVPKPNFLKIIEAEISLGADGVGGRYELIAEKNKRRNELICTFETVYWESFGERARVPVLYGGLCAFRRSAWESECRSFAEIRLFPSMASGEDTFVCDEIAKEFTLIYRRDLVGEHRTDISSRFFSRCRAQGFSKTRSIMHSGINRKSTLSVVGHYKLAVLVSAYAFGFSGIALLFFSFFAAVVSLSISLYLFFFSNRHFLGGRNRKSQAEMLLLIFTQHLGWATGIFVALFREVQENVVPTYELIRSGFGFISGSRLKRLFFFVTHRCNSGCTWCLDKKRANENRIGRELALCEISEVCRKTPGSIHYLTLTGGEPFLREDIPSIVLEFYERKRTRFVTIVSNGSLPERVRESIEQILILCPFLRLNIQLTVADIAGKHDDVRKHGGSYKNIRITAGYLRFLKGLFPQLIFSVATQFGQWNSSRAVPIVEQVKESLCPDQHLIAHIRDVPALRSPPALTRQQEGAVLQRLQELYPDGKSWFQRFYIHVVRETLKEIRRIQLGHARYRKCPAGKKFVTLYENGNVFVCENRQDLGMGNIRDQDMNLRAIVESPRGERASKTQRKEKCQCDWGCVVSENLLYDPLFLMKSAQRTFRKARKIWPISFLLIIFSFGASAFDKKALSAELKLDLAYHHQEHSLSCEAAALQMVLSYYKVRVSESEIIGRMPFDRTPKKDGVWGDPERGFVGDVDGKMPDTGYGIHWHALARLSSLWRKSRAFENGHLSDLTAELSHQHPVIIWGYDGSSSNKLRWKTKEGRSISAIDGEHVRVVYGFKGDSKNPSGFFVMDPESGPVFWTGETLLENWNSSGRAGVVVFKKRNELRQRRAGPESLNSTSPIGEP